MWQELKFRVSSENALLVEEKLFSSGAAAVTFLDARNQPIFVEETDQTPLWEDICIVSCLLYTSPSPRDVEESRMPSSA